MSDKLLLRINEAAERLGVSRSAAYTLIQRGEIRTIHIGKSRRVPAEALTEFVKRLEADEGIPAA